MTTTPSSHVYHANGGELALRPPVSDVPPDEPLEARRYVDAFRRSWPLILLIVVPLTVLVFVVSALFPKTYSSSAKLVLDTTGNPLEASDAASVQRRLATIQVLLTTRDVFARAARRLPGETPASVQDKVTSSVDPNANVITLAATDSTPRGAARIANAVASRFLVEQRLIQRERLPPTQQQIVLVTSALHGEGKTEVTAGLGLALSQAGMRTWLVSADMRWPRLHELFDVDQSPGLSEVLAGTRIYGDGVPDVLAADNPLQYKADTGRGSLHVLASGSKPRDPAKLLASDAVDSFFDQIKRSDYDYVLLDGPPLVGLVDSH